VCRLLAAVTVVYGLVLAFGGHHGEAPAWLPWVSMLLAAAGIDIVALSPEESKYGAVETREESRRCAELFKKNRERIDGVMHPIVGVVAV